MMEAVIQSNKVCILFCDIGLRLRVTGSHSFKQGFAFIFEGRNVLVFSKIFLIFQGIHYVAASKQTDRVTH